MTRKRSLVYSISTRASFALATPLPLLLHYSTILSLVFLSIV